jgi:hypothetical protein
MQYQPKPLDAGDVARALLDPSAPATDPAIQLLQVAMSGFGYNFYDARNVARANDQLVRGRVNDILGTAATSLGKLEKSYKARAFPEATREQPLPPPDVMRTIRGIDERRKRVEALASAIVAAETPATDTIWFRFRDERSLLAALVAFDIELSAGSDRVARAAASVSPATACDETLAPLDAELDALESAFAKRRELLRGGSLPGQGSSSLAQR